MDVQEFFFKSAPSNENQKSFLYLLNKTVQTALVKLCVFGGPSRFDRHPIPQKYTLFMF